MQQLKRAILGPLVATVVALFAQSTFAIEYVPTGYTSTSVSLDCRPSVLQQRIAEHFSKDDYASKTQTEVWSQLEGIIQDYFDRCDGELSRGSPWSLLDYVQMGLIRYNLDEHPQFRRINFLFSGDDLNIRGYLGLKPGKEKRPLVIFQCGLSCHSADPAMLFMAMTFFDMGPFHVLLLPSNSSPEFISDNKVFAIGGLEEGRQLTKMAALIKSGQWDFSKRVSRIHLFGMSLGGHSSLYAALYGARNFPRYQPLFDTVAVGCPVVNLDKSLDHITSESFIARLLRVSLLSEALEALFLIPFFRDMFGDDEAFRKPDETALRTMLKEGALDYYKGATKLFNWHLAPFEDLNVNSAADLWSATNFADWPIGSLETPVFTWAPRDDDVVLFEDNSHHLFEEDKRFAKRRVFRLDTDKGGHCAFPAQFGWRATSAVLNGLFITRSPEILKMRKETVLPLSLKDLGRKQRAHRRDLRLGYRWIAEANQDSVTLISKFRALNCGGRGRMGRRCFRYAKSRVPYSKIGLSKEHIPPSKVEAEELTRWLNARITLRGKDGRPLTESGNPASLSIVKYNER